MHEVLNKRRLRRLASGVAAAAVALSPASAFAAGDITNTATANGTPSRGTFIAPTDTENVPIADPNPVVAITKTVTGVTVGSGSSATYADGGDTVTFRYVVQNTGNVTLTNVTPVDSGPTFNGVAGENNGTPLTFTHLPADGSNTPSVTPASVAPGQTVVFSATYTLTNVDAFLGATVDNGLDNSATATAANYTPTTNTSTVETDIPGAPALIIAKSFSITTDNGTTGEPDANDVVTYTYTVTNTGNVVMTNVSIADVHEGAALTAGLVQDETLVTDGPLASATAPVASTDGTADDGIWDTLQPGAQITFTYVHTVTQPEFDSQ